VKRALIVLIAVAVAVWFGGSAAAGDDPIGGHNTGDGTILDGQHHEQSGIPGIYHPGQPYQHSEGPPPPLYKDYYTPACGVNGPPNMGDDALCMAAVSVCKTQGQPDALYMQHWHQQVSPTTGPWEYVGTECRGPDDPVRQQPKVTVEMVLDQAYAAAPKPTAVVQPGNRSFVNLPNNYYAEAPSQTVPVVVLGQSIPVTFTVTEVRWDFGDGSTATGTGIKDAALHQPGAIEHQYAAQGSYDITATSVISVSFTLPGGGRQDLPGALEIPSAATTLPVGEIQTRVDSTG
jgi:hypothetical protein